MAEKLTAQEQALAKRVGAGGTDFVRARRKSPGLSLLDYQTRQNREAAEELGVESTTAPAGETSSGSSAR